MFNSVAYSHVRLNSLQNLDALTFNIETDYQEFSSSGSLGSSYDFSLPNTTPSLRVYTLNIPVLRYYFNADGTLDLLTNRGVNIAWIEWMYNIHKLDRFFLLTHPVYGDVKVRFKEPLKIPKGKSGGQACVEALEFQLVELPSSNLYAQFTPETLTDLSFDFPHHSLSTEYQQEGLTTLLGGNYTYAVRGSKPEQRIFTLYFRGLKYFQDNSGLIDTAIKPDLNMGRLEQFYSQFKLSRSFYYQHPSYGKIKVRFNKSLKIPKLIQNSDGWVGDFQLELVEEVEDAKRYY